MSRSSADCSAMVAAARKCRNGDRVLRVSVSGRVACEVECIMLLVVDAVVVDAVVVDSEWKAKESERGRGFSE